MGKELRGREAGVLVDANLFRYLAHGVDYLFLLVETGHSLLRIVTPAHGLPYVEGAGIRLQLAEQQLYEGGFTGTVGTDYSHFLVTCEGVGPVAQYTDVAERLADTFSLKNLIADI